MCSTSRPVALLVSICSASDLRPMSLAANSSISLSKSGSDRPSRSRRVTTTVSPRRSGGQQLIKAGTTSTGAGGDTGPDPLTARRAQRVNLPGRGLLVARYPCVPQQLHHGRFLPLAADNIGTRFWHINSPAQRYRTRGSQNLRFGSCASAPPGPDPRSRGLLAPGRGISHPPGRGGRVAGR
jgi:hypothetical protein